MNLFSRRSSAPAGHGAIAAALAALIAGLICLGGCSTAQELLEGGGKKVDYKSAGQLPPLDIPPDLTAPTRDNRYVVPEIKSATTLSSYQADRKSQPRPGSTGVLPLVESMRIERSGTQRWLVVNDTPEKLWPLVKEFWQENGFLLETENPETGLMETDWAENRAKIPQDMLRNLLGKMIDQLYSTAERDRFRTRLERGTDLKWTEIYLSHRGMMEIYTTEARAETKWQPRPPDPDLEAEFLRRLMIRLGAKEEGARQMLSSAPQALRAALTRQSDGSERLDVLEPFDRAWRRVGLALDRVGFTVEDRNRQKGLYFVRYADPEKDMAKADAEKPGLLSKLIFWKSDASKVTAEQYRVLLSQGGDKSQVQVLGKDGSADGSQTARRILTLLHEQLK
ncbi:MAG: outer membrane protein assembly factor BamC [Betaproteobacteria bacterium]|nr:outer membrane protein assembly factor BamC [Betaproteobacteria bacterium]